MKIRNYVALVLMLMVLVVASAFRLADEAGDFADLEGVLVWFAVGGGAMWLWGVILARVLENIVFWHNLKPWIKKLFPMAFAAGIGFLAEALIAVDILQYIPEGVAVILLAGINYYFSQREYGAIKDSYYGDSTESKALGG